MCLFAAMQRYAYMLLAASVAAAAIAAVDAIVRRPSSVALMCVCARRQKVWGQEGSTTTALAKCGATQISHLVQRASVRACVQTQTSSTLTFNKTNQTERNVCRVCERACTHDAFSALPRKHIYSPWCEYYTAHTHTHHFRYPWGIFFLRAAIRRAQRSGFWALAVAAGKRWVNSKCPSMRGDALRSKTGRFLNIAGGEDKNRKPKLGYNYVMCCVALSLGRPSSARWSWSPQRWFIVDIVMRVCSGASIFRCVCVCDKNAPPQPQSMLALSFCFNPLRTTHMMRVPFHYDAIHIWQVVNICGLIWSIDVFEKGSLRWVCGALVR